MLDYRLRYKIIAFFSDINVKGFRKLASKLPYWLIPSPQSACVIKTLDGLNLFIDPILDNGVEKSLYYTGTYEKGTLYVMKQILKEGDVFVDIGANIGLMSILAGQIVKTKGKVVSFEPNPVTREILIKNIHLNNLSNLEVSAFAIGSNIENAKIYDRWDSNRGSATLIKPQNQTDSYNVEIIRLIDYFKSKTRIRLIKIDVEGFELNVIKGAKDLLLGSDSPILIVEVSESRENSFGSNLGLIYEELLSCDYKIFKGIGGKERVSKLIEINTKADLPKHDNVYCFKLDHLRTISKHLFKN